ncbi:phosphoribosylformylglycinamidine synthase subunit PurL [Kamptonema cortianum]|nr:phosphoribosylformylglycinamidine synthase subunit PurL [Geitlerinema splendidum]MDK3155949.1 phosphoribosylformylglycinamidine synthase subunit PurL [Kamptonema cortianum]
MATLAPELVKSMGLRESEYERIVNLMGREPTLTEVGMFAVMWSEHCGYKYSRPILSYFSQYKAALEGDGLENAGIVDIGDGLGVVMKVESHNHPSAVEPYQGAATGVGGIIRDIFTMGARPIACLNSLRFGPIRDGLASAEQIRRNRYLVDGVVRGIAGYGNCVGVPTVGGEVAFHPSFNGRPLVNAMCVGIVETDKVATAGAGGIGNPVIYLGSATGKDGIHGATFASEELEDDDDSKRPNVQIGDPLAEKQLIEATLEALQTGAIHSIQDMGAAGLTCSTVEMSAKGGVGMRIDLDKVPMRESDMSGYELMLSESQERMLCVAHRGREQEVIDVFHKWGVHAEVIGTVTDDGLVTVTRHGEIIAQVTAKHLADECPTYRTEPQMPESVRRAQGWSPSDLPSIDPAEALTKLAQSPTLASKRWVYQQYDHQVQTQTALLPGDGDAAVLAPRGTKKGLAVKIDGNGRWIMGDPHAGGLLAVAEAARNVACTGAVPVAVTDGLNYGSPEDPGVYYIFERSVKGLADACEAMGTPVVSGNVSFYNHGDSGPVLPSPMIGMLGVLSDADKRIGMRVTDAGTELALVWYENELRQQGLGASTYLAEVHGIEDGAPVAPKMDKEKQVCHLLAGWADRELIDAAHDVSEGGLLFALAEMLAKSSLGGSFSLPETIPPGLRNDAYLFGEFPGWVIVAGQPGFTDSLQADLPEGIFVKPLGVCRNTNTAEIVHNGTVLATIAWDSWIKSYEACLESLLN